MFSSLGTSPSDSPKRGREVSERILASWSGGKDSAMALFELIQSGLYDIAALVTTVTEDLDRISMHGVRRVLLEQQAEQLGFPLEQVLISPKADNAQYEARMGRVFARKRDEGVNRVAYGDLFLEDIKKYRESHLASLGMAGLFPLWMKDTTELIHRFIALGFKAIVTCVDSETLDGSFAGSLIDESFLRRLPSRVDPCGENGEFHTFVFDGPIFKKGVRITAGEVVQRGRFWFRDLLPS